MLRVPRSHAHSSALQVICCSIGRAVLTSIAAHLSAALLGVPCSYVHSYATLLGVPCSLAHSSAALLGVPCSHAHSFSALL